MPALRSLVVSLAVSALVATLLLTQSASGVDAARQPGSDPGGFTAVGSRVYFAATTAAHGRELWVSDGTAAGTHEVADINPAPGEGSSPEQLTVMDGRVFFFAYDGSGCALWKSDGTTDGTKRLGGGDLCEMGNLAKVGRKLFFTNDIGLWVSDGSAGGTRQIADIGQYSGPHAQLNGDYYFFNSTTRDTWDLWKSNGTPAGTSIVTEMAIPPEFASYEPADMISAGGLLYFRIGQIYPGGSTSTDLWQSDGTAAGTRKVRDFDEDQDQVTDLTKLGDKAYFAVDVGSTGPGTNPALWKSNGTESGTKIVKSISPDVITSVGSRLFLFAADGSGMALWESRGTASTTTKVYSVALPTCTMGSNDPYCLLDPTPAAVGSRLFFPANSPGNGIELWVSDGTTAGTHMVKNIDRGDASSNPSNLASAGSLLYFAARSANHGRELWVSDGTAAGTHMVLDINPG